MKKIILITLLLLTCACEQKSDPKDISKEETKNVLSSKGTLSLSGEKLIKPNIVYILSEDTAIYSNNTLILYIDENDQKVNLNTVLKDKMLTIDDIILNFEQYNVSDNGSIVYRSKNEKVYLVKCNSDENNKNIFITDFEDVLQYCTK